MPSRPKTEPTTEPRASRRWCGDTRRFHVPTPTLTSLGRALVRLGLPACGPRMCNHALTCRTCGLRLAACPARVCPSAETSAHLWLDRA